MIKKKITYTDYNGNARTETFYFNLSKADIISMETGTKGGFENKLKAIVEAQDVHSILRMIKEIILMSYGEKSEDGRSFKKSEELSAEFAATEAFSTLYMELISNEKAASDFINGIIPADLAAEIAKKPQLVENVMTV